MQRIRRALRIRFPLILDEYVMGSFLRNFALVLVSLVMLFIIFTFFELIGDILRYRTPLSIVGDYLLNLIPFILNSSSRSSRWSPCSSPSAHSIATASSPP